MKKKVLLFGLTISLSGVIGLTIYSGTNNKFLNHISYADDEYSLCLVDQKINSQNEASLEEKTTNLSTNQNNQITFKSANLVNYDAGWQSVLPNGYFYNPINNTSYKNKISGIKSITYTSDNNNSLDLYFGYSLNSEDIIYSNKTTLTANTPYTFSNEHPSYFYIENKSGNTIDINSFSITYSCNEESYPRNDLKILMIGNSFADDTLFYEERIAESYGISLDLYDAYIAGCTINQHYTNLTNGNATYSMRNMIGDSWNYSDDMTLEDIISSHTWDIITFQQASAEIGRPTSYSNLENLVTAVRTLVGPSPKFYWHQTWAYDKEYHDYNDYFSYFGNDQMNMYDAIVDCYENEVEPLGLFEKMIPAGTVVQDLRTSYMKDTFSRDGKHMSSVHGRYLLGLNFLSSVFDVDLYKSPCSYLPTEVNSSFLTIANEAVKNAHNHPLEVVNSLYPTKELEGYNLNDYTEIDAGLVGCSYWNSTDGSNYNKRFSNVSGTSNLYTSTSRFTSLTLPIGSLVVIDEAFGVRPEAWVDDAQQGSRPNETYANLIEIDSSFWDGYQYRAFNIFKAGKTTLLGQYNQIFDGFHIYVPNDSLGIIPPKNANNSYNSDKAVFKSSDLNIDAYERLHLDPITGFYKCDSYYELTNSYVDDTAKKFVCTRPFYSANNDLPENTVIVVDSGYQWRSDCWGSHGSYSPRPGNVSSPLTRLTSSFWDGFRRRTFNVSSTSSSYVNQNYLDFMNHMRIYIPISDDIELEHEDLVTMTALGYATLNSAASSMYGKSDIPVLITLSGDDSTHLKVEVDGSQMTTTKYTYVKNTGALSIATEGTIGGGSFTLGTITGVVDSDAGTISNISVDGSISSYLTNNGSVICRESFHDRCNYATNAASQLVWQRWYMTNSWQANSGTGEWTTASSSYRLDNDYSMGLRIANNSYGKTRFTLKNDFGGGAGFTPKGISIWLYNPNGNIYSSFRIYVYTTASSISGDHAVPSASYSQVYSTSDIGNGTWKNIKLGLNSGTIYNVSFYFETSSSATTYVYLGHVSFY